MRGKSTNLRIRLPVFLFVAQVTIVAFYAAFVTYDDQADARFQNNRTKPMENAVYKDYPMFTDIQVIIFLGFGCLFAFFRLYGFGGMVFNLLTAAFSIQWAILVQGYFQFSHDGKIHLGVINLIYAEFACAVVLISFGAVLGKTSPLQLLVMALLEVPVFAVTEWAVLKYLKINDSGGSILIHLFACYFGLGVTFVLYRPHLNEGHAKANTSYQSDILSLIGTLFLWVFWPSFNSSLTLKGDDQHRAILHTFIGLSASTLTAFALSAMLNKNGKITISDIQNVTLAGGGDSGGVCGYDDNSCSCICSGAPVEGDPKLHKLQILIPGLQPGLGRTAREQALFQVAAVFSTIGVSTLGGILTGFVLKLPYLAPPSDVFCFDDQLFFEVPPDYDSPLKLNNIDDSAA
ncbi:hypothetical protein CgunFtcFv8_000808 [Champsocephalus gunnari]|uniref:Ammonium transporter AmtB-like domain-containing protein n=1 Tax=Champsocephalus gunnari TaxID=52237 RepID=A0AAN8DPJ3_CHAGU|nr:hypothetical protein CgunFtcFv8_000808 [Champsocephalus gunnari]